MKLPFETGNLKPFLYFAPAFFLALAIAAEIGWGNRVRLPLPQPKAQPPRAGLVAPLRPEFSLPPLEQNFNDMLLRPLFVPTRRSPPPVTIKPPTPAMIKGQFVLVGSILTGARNIALLREIATNKVLRLEQGKTINGILLEKVDRRSVTLKQGGDREELVMKVSAAPKPQPQQLPIPARSALPGAQAQAPPSPPPVLLPLNPQTDPHGLIAQRRASHGFGP